MSDTRSVLCSLTCYSPTPKQKLIYSYTLAYTALASFAIGSMMGGIYATVKALANDDIKGCSYLIREAPHYNCTLSKYSSPQQFKCQNWAPDTGTYYYDVTCPVKTITDSLHEKAAEIIKDDISSFNTMYGVVSALVVIPAGIVGFFAGKSKGTKTAEARMQEIERNGDAENRIPYRLL